MSTPNDTHEEKRFPWREPVAVLVAIALVDATVYHGIGFSGAAVLLFALPLLFLFGTAKPLLNWQTVLFAGLASLVSLKLIWSGNENVVLLGLGTVFLFAALQAGVPLHLKDLGKYSMSWLYSPVLCCKDYYQALRRWNSAGWAVAPAKLAAVFVPLGLLCMFGTIFIFANPDLQETVQRGWTAFLDWLGRFSDWMPAFPQVILWAVTAWMMIGLLRPQSLEQNWDFGTSPRTLPRRVPQYDPQTGMYIGMAVLKETTPAPPQEGNNHPAQSGTPPQVGNHSTPGEGCHGAQQNGGVVSPIGTKQEKSFFYYAYFNSLLALIALFSIYLVFEFAKNWTRDFPSGFKYSQHMHQGAAYLTLALALTTIVLCTIFHGRTLLDPRLKMLLRLAMIWLALNLLLAAAVYNRLYIYIDLNGLSMRRIAGLLGTTAVVLGLVMVVRMILRSEGIRWLVYRYTWSVLAIIFVGFIFPFDWYVSHHNVSRIMKGDLAPSVFLFPAHNSQSWCEPEHYLASLPLLESDDEIIREGAKALFADYYLSVQRAQSYEGYQWTAFQWSRYILMNTLEARQEEFRAYMDHPTQRQEAIQAFRTYTNRWI